MNVKLGVLLLIVVGWLGLGTVTATQPRPNVVMLISDDQTWTDFGFMGHPVVNTPHLDRLASEGLLFPHGYVTMSLCRPSLASMITGLYPHQSRIATAYPLGTPMLDHPPRLFARTGEYWRLHQRMIQFIDFIPTLPSLLGEWGYKSLQTGKWWEGHFGRGGFTSGMTLGTPIKGDTKRVAWNWRGGDRGVAIAREVGLKPIYDFIEHVEDRPFFIWYAPAIPHNPHNPPQRLLEKYVDKTESVHIARYWAMCEWFDETCGELLDYLDRNDLAENTLVVFVVDNGYIPRIDAPGADYARSKGSTYDGGIRTPIILRWPGRIEPRRDDGLVSIVDLAPTILTACGLKPTEQMSGLDLLDPVALAARKAIFGAVYTHSAADINRPERSLKARWGIESNWKLIVPGIAYVEDPQISRRYELYNLEADPHEKNNLAAAHPDRVERLRLAINQWWPAQ